MGNQFIKEDRLTYVTNRITKTDSCWLWTGPFDKDGYGKAHRIRAHRLAYIVFKGEIPDGMSVCHTCDTPACCNPEHLWLGTVGDNARDRDMKRRGRHSRKTHCDNGHEFNENNTYWYRNHRMCKTCMRTKSLQYYHEGRPYTSKGKRNKS